MNIRFKIIILVLILINSCGYKVLDQSLTNNYEIKNINIVGDSRTNYRIKNFLLMNSKKDSETNLTIDINTKISKNVKEKNIKNEITKYNLSLYTDISLLNIVTGKTYKFNISLVDEYSVGNNYLTTINNEKSTKQRLAKKVSDMIIERINNLK